MKGFSFNKTYIIICDRCNENIVERMDETELNTLSKAYDYAIEHKEQHVKDGSW